jgi:hypothetical protein
VERYLETLLISLSHGIRPTNDVNLCYHLWSIYNVCETKSLTIALVLTFSYYVYRESRNSYSELSIT